MLEFDHILLMEGYLLIIYKFSSKIKSISEILKICGYKKLIVQSKLNM